MGCAAGKHVTSSPEVSSSTNVTTAVSKENGWPFVALADNPRKSVKRGAIQVISKRGDSSENKITGKPNPKCTSQRENNGAKHLPTSTQDGVECKEFNSLVIKRPTIGARVGNSEVIGKPIPLGQIKVQMTQSQVDFFKMLDTKINEGPDYISDTDT